MSAAEFLQSSPNMQSTLRSPLDARHEAVKFVGTGFFLPMIELSYTSDMRSHCRVSDTAGHIESYIFRQRCLWCLNQSLNLILNAPPTAYVSIVLSHRASPL